MTPDGLSHRQQTAVRQVHLEEIDKGLNNLHGYNTVLVFFRVRGSVIGETTYEIKNGRITSEELRKGLVSLAWPIWQKLSMKEPIQDMEYPLTSIVVCTRDREDDLKECLNSMLPIISKGGEAIVVDNSPRDDSTAKLLRKYPLFRYVLEPKPGLNVARNIGIKCATGDIVAFTDDDVVVDENWLEKILQNFTDPTVGVVTGIALPLELKTQAQYWFEKTNSFKRGFDRKKFDISNFNPIAAGLVGAGVNMAIRRSCLARIGNFDEALGCGTPTRSGGDQEFFYRTLSRGYRIVYEPDAIVWHRHRHTWDDLRRAIYGYGVGLFAWWTRALIIEREISLLWWGLHWFFQHHVGNIIRSVLKRPGRIPFDLALAEFAGAIIGPFCYLLSRFKSRSFKKNI